MAEQKKRISIEVLRQLVPLSQLTQDNLRDLAEKTGVESLPAGSHLFRVGDSDNNSFYLISGVMELVDGHGEKAIVGGTAAARFPLDHHRPRQATARARTGVEIIRVDNDLLDILLTWDQNAGFLVTEIRTEQGGSSGENDWMTNILRSSLFHKIPPANIQAMFMRMQQVPVNAGDVIIRQGDDGDFYYYISKGRCLVTRDAIRNDKVIRLAELDAGTSFGEEALISGAKRNANVTMLTDGVLMRLGKTDFEELLKAPVLSTVSYEDALGLVKQGAVWLDVRLENEHKNYALPGSLHIPFYLLRIRSAELGNGRKYVIYCDTGRRSSSAAYLLSERGFDVYVLEGGLMALKQEHTA